MEKNFPVTTAIRVLRENNIEFTPYLFNYIEKGGTKQTAEELSADEHNIIKTLIMETENGDALVVLMHGDKEVSTKELARILKVKKINTCEANKSMRLTGYQFGGTSPFGLRTKLPIYAESSIFQLSNIFINGGKRGFIIEINPLELLKAFNLVKVNVAI